MTYATRKQAVASLREFAPWLRAKHEIVKFWSATANAYRYSRIFVP
jgi:hypothetical protein